ncbi:unnamed protein product [Urochloa humidicola]
METLTNQRAPSESPATRPRWLMLDPGVNDDNSDPSAADTKTKAASCTSTGQSFTVSFNLAAPPATSRFYCDWIGGAPGDGSARDSDNDDDPPLSREESKDLSIIAAHDGCLLIETRVPDQRRGNIAVNDFFVYESGGGGARLPSLSPIPGCYFSTQFGRDRDACHVPSRSDSPRMLDRKDTGVLRRGEGDLVVVAQLEVMWNDEGAYGIAELCALRPGGDWDIKRLPIVHHDGGKLPKWPVLDAAVPVGDRFMCWVDYINGIFVCDMEVEETTSPKVVYAPLPVPPPVERWRSSERTHMQNCRNLVASSPDTVSLVSVASRCCCGGPGKTECERSRFAFNVTTWSLTLSTEGPMTWVKDGVLDCDEIWQLPNYGSLPRVAPRYPIMSADNPDIVCFVICENNFCIDDPDETEWMIMIDTRRKELLSVLRGDTNLYIDSRVPVKLCW